MLTHGILPAFRGGVHSFISPTSIGPVPSSFFLFSSISLIADGPHHYHPACGHKGSSHLSPVHALQFFYRDASSALLQLVNQWLNFTYSRSHAFRYESKNTNPTLVRIELTTSVLADVQLTYYFNRPLGRRATPGHAIRHRWRSLPRIRRHRSSSPQGGFSNECCLFRSHHGPINVALSFPTPTIGMYLV